ncbi:hypothetical protein FRC09_004592 [Ceratobasidium sp. 395]|nr:hypothetical protein FRC09_004592 [Ceratobasidium sp. 395]
MAQYNSNYSSDANDLVPDHTFARVCTYWRSTAINLPTLWTHIVITPAQANYEYAILSLDRSAGLPIYLDVSSTGKVEEWDDQSQAQWETFLANAIEKVHVLNIVDLFPTAPTFLDKTIELFLHLGSPGVLKTLCIQRPCVMDQLSNLADFPANQSDPILRSITVLHLSDALLPWNSVAYHNLIDLRPQFIVFDEWSISTLELGGILAASPGLTTLKLEYITITHSGDWNAENVVRLARLEVLYLLYVDYDSWVALASVLSLSDCLGTLEVSVRHRGDSFSEVFHLVRDFLHGVRVKTLSVPAFGDDDAQWALSLSATIPSLESLVLPDYDLNWYGHEAIGNEPEINVDTPPRLPHLFVASSKLDLDGLKLIVSIYGVETLHLDNAESQYGSDSGPLRDELRVALLDAFPHLTCLITDEDTTLKWPCRTFAW